MSVIPRDCYGTHVLTAQIIEKCYAHRYHSTATILKSQPQCNSSALTLLFIHVTVLNFLYSSCSSLTASISAQCAQGMCSVELWFTQLELIINYAVSNQNLCRPRDVPSTHVPCMGRGKIRDHLLTLYSVLVASVSRQTLSYTGIAHAGI